MDPTHKKHPKSTTSKPHSKHPDPTIAASTTIHKISNQFSNLYANHKALSSLKSPNPSSQPCTIDTHFQAKAISTSVIDDDSSTTSFRNSSHQLSRSMVEMDKQSLRVKSRKVKENQNKPSKESHDKDEKLWKKQSEKKQTHEGHGMKKSSLSLSRIQESEIKVSQRPSLPLAMGGGGGGGGRRKSFCSSNTELADFFTCNGVKVVSVDMPPFMQVHAVDLARKTYDSLEKFTSKTLASNLKKEFDGVYGPAWHCIVGTSFGSFVTHSVGGFLYFSMDHKIYVLLFKTTVQRAD